jgi:protein arginine kinase
MNDIRSSASGFKKTTDLSENLWNFGSWLSEEDEFSDVILSSRIRLARNVRGYPFPNRATGKELEKVVLNVEGACRNSSILGKAAYYDMHRLSEWDSRYFVERRLASPQFIENNFPALLVIGPRENLSIMVNEEDHLRLQCIEAGINLKKAWKNISNLDDHLEYYINFAYSSKYGYVTSCPTNLGTGVRASVSMHLPAMAMQHKIESMVQKLPTSEIAVRGFYGEGSESIGDVYQISNQLTLGRTEEHVIERVLKTAKNVVEMERRARNKLLNEDRISLEDGVYRALGLLQHARIISSYEALDLLSVIRLGVETALIKNISRLAVSQLLVLVQPAHLQKIYRRGLEPSERDILRAEFIRENLSV